MKFDTRSSTRVLWIIVMLVAWLGGRRDVEAQVLTYVDRAEWDATLGAIQTETFDSFPADAYFDDGQSVDIGDFVITGFGDATVGGNVWNLVDVPPMAYGSLNGTACVAARVADYQGQYVGFDIVFDEPIVAWGADWGVNFGSFRVLVDGVEADRNTQFHGGFYGVLSGVPFTTIRIDTYPDFGGATTFLDDFVYAREIGGCFGGTVDLANGSAADILYVNGGTVNVDVSADDDVELLVTLPPAGGNGKFALYGTHGVPSIDTMSLLPSEVGTSCFPFLLSNGAAPSFVATNLNKPDLATSHVLGVPFADPERASTRITLSHLWPGLTLTFQAVILDPGSLSPKAASTSNAVVLETY